MEFDGMLKAIQTDMNVRKRDGRLVDFDASKITAALRKAGEATGEYDHAAARRLTIRVLTTAQTVLQGTTPTVEDVQDISEEVTDYYEDSAEKAVALSAAILDEMGVESERIIHVGRAADVILDIAEERDVDMIVVGHRGLGAMRRFVLGSVSSKLSHAAKCALLLAPVTDEVESGAP